MQKGDVQEEKLENAAKQLGTIRGRVTYTRGAVPLAEVKVTRVKSQAADIATPVVPTASATVDIETRSATTDLAGAYELTDLEPGSYQVVVTPPKGWRYKAEPQSLELVLGEAKVADFQLERIPLETVFEGRVLNCDGQPAVGARLEDVICNNKLESAVTDSEGRFIFRQVTPGNRFVRVNLSGHVSEVHDFTIEEGEKITLNLNLKKAAYRIQGSVANAEGKPVEATVQLFQGGPFGSLIAQKTQTNNENGSFEFYVQKGDYSILVQAPFYELAPWAGSVAEDKKIDFQLERIDPRRHTHPVLSPTEAESGIERF